MKLPILRRYLKQFPVKLLMLFVSFVLAVYLFGFIVHEVLWEKEEQADSMVASYISTHVVSPDLTKFMKIITFFGSTYFLLIAYTTLALWNFFYRKTKAVALDIAAIGISGFLVTFFLKELFHRVRPLDPLIDPLRNYSFPSGHASTGFIFYGLIAYLIWRTKMNKTYIYIVCGSLIFFSLLIGFSRIYLRIHYASDVLAGFCMGFAWLAFSLWVLNKFRGKA